MKRGRPFEPGNQFGHGRPRGSRNKKKAILQQVLEEHAPALLRKGLLLAIEGDAPLLRLFLDRVLPRPQDSPVRMGRLPMTTIEEVVQAQIQIWNKLTSGELTPAQARQFDALLGSRREVIVTQDVEARLRKLENAQKETQE
jgi:hypothetical protein